MSGLIDNLLMISFLYYLFAEKKVLLKEKNKRKINHLQLTLYLCCDPVDRLRKELVASHSKIWPSIGAFFSQMNCIQDINIRTLLISENLFLTLLFYVAYLMIVWFCAANVCILDTL